MKSNIDEGSWKKTTSITVSAGVAGVPFAQSRKIATARGGYVKHDYTDRYHDPVYHTIESELEVGECTRRGPRGGVTIAFPEKLYSMLNDAEEKFPEIVGWQQHGRCFVVRQPERFVSEVMPTYFRQSKLTSFQRQVNLYGFRRLTVSEDRGGYYHELFLRGRPDLSKLITRVRVKGTGCKFKSSPSTEPNFYSFPPCTESGPSYYKDAVVTDSSEDEARDSGSECCLKKEAMVDSHSSLRSAFLTSAAAAKDASNACDQGAFRAPLSLNNVTTLAQNQEGNAATQVVNHNGSNETPLLVAPPITSDSRPLPAPRMLPHFQNYQTAPTQQTRPEAPTFVSQGCHPLLVAPTPSGKLGGNKQRHVTNDFMSSEASQPLLGCPEADLFDIQVAHMFDGPTDPVALTLDDLVEYFVQPMLEE